MLQAKKGDSVKVHYTGKHTDGTIFDSSLQREPLAFSVGAGQMIQGFDEAVVGMQIGEQKTVNIPAEKAYGLANESMIFPVNLAEIPQDIELTIGLPLTAHTNQGQPITVVVKEITAEQVFLDANHPLAGKELIFEIEMIEISAGN